MVKWKIVRHARVVRTPWEWQPVTPRRKDSRRVTHARVNKPKGTEGRDESYNNHDTYVRTRRGKLRMYTSTSMEGIIRITVQKVRLDPGKLHQNSTTEQLRKYRLIMTQGFKGRKKFSAGLYSPSLVHKIFPSTVHLALGPWKIWQKLFSLHMYLRECFKTQRNNVSPCIVSRIEQNC